MKQNIENILSEKRKNPFLTPEGYFDNLSDRIMSQIPDEVHESSSDRIRNLHWLWTSSAACVIAVIVGLAALLYIDNLNSDEYHISEAMSEDEEYQENFIQYSNLDQNDVYDYLAGLDYQ